MWRLIFPVLFLQALLAVTARPAHALDVGVSGGGAFTVNDPFLRHPLVRVNLAFAPQPHYALELTVGSRPPLGDDWTDLTTQLVEEVHVSPDLSTITWVADGTALIYPVRSFWQQMEARLGFYGGFGVTRTADDLEALQAEGDADAEATQYQIHPSMVWGFISEFDRDLGSVALGVRLRWDHRSFVEVVNSSTLETKNHTMLGIEGVLWL